jgi:hypothetical protein
MASAQCSPLRHSRGSETTCRTIEPNSTRRGEFAFTELELIILHGALAPASPAKSLFGGTRTGGAEG